jgi:quinol monooxygenase YgiN
MYAQIVRRTPNRERQRETLQRAGTGFFPKLKQAPGFVAFYLIAGEDGRNSAVAIWEDRAQVEAFWETQRAWMPTLDELGNREESRTAGEVTTHVAPRR